MIISFWTASENLLPKEMTIGETSENMTIFQAVFWDPKEP